MKAVFLDIEGVIQPYDGKNRFNHTNEELDIKLSRKYNTDYTKYNIFDICAAYYDWDKKAIKLLREILEETDSKIIITSIWRKENQPYFIRDLLKIHKLDKYWFADNEIIKEYMFYLKKRAKEISNSINKYDIDNFVILDDMRYLNEFFPDNTVSTYNLLTEKNKDDAIKILKKS